MSDIKSILLTLIAAAVAIFGGMISLLTSPIPGVAPVAFVVMFVSLGIIFISYREWQRFEQREKQEELESQQERDKVQLEILQQLRALNTKIGNSGIYEQLADTQRMVDTFEDFAKQLETPDTHRLNIPENEQGEDSSKDLPPEADNPQSQSSQQKPPR